MKDEREVNYTRPQDQAPSRSPMKSVLVLILGLLSAVYLANPTAGFVEFIPDNIPGLGNLDEGAASLLLISCLAYFGLDLRVLLKERNKKSQS